MSAADQPYAPDDFGVALTSLSEERARALLASESCPEPYVEDAPDAWEESTEAFETEERFGDELVVFQPENVEAWMQSSTYVALDECR